MDGGVHSELRKKVLDNPEDVSSCRRESSGNVSPENLGLGYNDADLGSQRSTKIPRGFPK